MTQLNLAAGQLLRPAPVTVRTHTGRALAERLPALADFVTAGARVPLSRHPDWLPVLEEGLGHVPDHANLLWNVANLLISTGRDAEARAVVERLPTGALPGGRVEFLRASLKVRDGFWREAALWWADGAW